MSIFINILLALAITLTASAQEVNIVHYSSFCEGNAGLGIAGSYRERIKDVGRRNGGNFQFTAIVIRMCGQPVVPLTAIKSGDKLLVTTSQVESAVYQLANGKEILRRYGEEECDCAYQFRMEVALDTVSAILIDGKALEKTDEKFITQPLRYFIFNGDTTGYEDKYGKRQGSIILKRKNDLLKSTYRDGIQIECALLSLDGKLIRKERDCDQLVQN